MINRPPTICNQTCFPLPSTAPPGFVRPKAAQPKGFQVSFPFFDAGREGRGAFGYGRVHAPNHRARDTIGNRDSPCVVAKIPVPIPPTRAPTRCVWNTSRVSSTCAKIVILRPAMFMLIHGIVPDRKPSEMAPQPATTPAAGVMATRPVIMPVCHVRMICEIRRSKARGYMPWMAPMTEGLRKYRRSMPTQTRDDIAVQMLVFKTATPASGDAAYGSPAHVLIHCLCSHFRPTCQGYKVPAATRGVISTRTDLH